MQSAQTQQVQNAKITTHIPTATAGQQQQVCSCSLLLIYLTLFLTPFNEFY